MKVGERLIGVGVICLGLGGLALAYGIWAASRNFGLPPPVGMLPGNPFLISPLNPMNCFMPIMGVGGVLLVLDGLWRVVSPE